MSTTFNHSICEPLNPVVLQKGAIATEQIIPLLESFPWETYLLEMQQAEEQGKEIHYAPSLEFDNESQGQGLVISAVGEPEEFEFYIFYKRPKGEDPAYISDLTGQTKATARSCVEALIAEDYDFLEDYFTEIEPVVSYAPPVAPTPSSVPSKKLSFWARLKQMFS